MTSRRAAKETVFGSCMTASLIEDGMLQSTVDAPGWHRKCRGEVANGNGKVTRCECPCHQVSGRLSEALPPLGGGPVSVPPTGGQNEEER